MASQPKTKEKAKAGEKAEGEEKVETEEKTEHALSSCAKTKTFILEYFWVSMSRNWNENYKVVYYAALVFVLTSSAILPLTESYIQILWISLLPSSASNKSKPPFGIIDSFVAVSDYGGKLFVGNYFVLWIISFHLMAIFG